MICGNLMENIGHGYLDPMLLIKLETMDKKELHLQLIFLVLVIMQYLGLIVTIIFGYLVEMAMILLVNMVRRYSN